MRRRLLLLALPILMAAWLPASAAADGQVTGTVSSQAGGVEGARVVLVSADHQQAFQTTSSAGGGYTVFAPAGSYSIGVAPPASHGDGYFEQDGLTVSDGDTTTLDPVLPATNGVGELSGTIDYRDGGGAVGMQVFAAPINSGGPEVQPTAETDEAGHWSSSSLPAGTYVLNFWVRNNGFRTPVGSAFATLGADRNVVLATDLSGPPADALLIGTTTTAEGFPGSSPAKIIPSANPSMTYYSESAERGTFRAWLPAGQYTFSLDNSELFGISNMLDNALLTQTVSVSSGAVARVQLQSSPLAVPAGTGSRRSVEELGYLNAQRAQWGLPAGLSLMPIWSDACAAHDAYLAIHNKLQHFEDAGASGYSPGGNWGGRHSVLAQSSTWSAQTNPWNDAPIHLNQLMAPDLSVVGIDDSHGYQCLTTMPGRLRPLPPGTVSTYPGNGTVGIPPAELAEELPQVPGQEVGITGIAGRELFVYQQNSRFFGGPAIQSASLTSAAGQPVEVRWVDRRNDNVGPALFGAIIIPVRPLAAYTTYTASASLEPLVYYDSSNQRVELPATTHTWSFTTGAPNPSGRWPGSESGSGQESSQRKGNARPSLRARRLGKRVRVRGWHFNPGIVVLKDRTHKKVLQRIRVRATGAFRVTLKASGDRFTLLARQGNRSAKARVAAARQHRSKSRH